MVAPTTSPPHSSWAQKPTEVGASASGSQTGASSSAPAASSAKAGSEQVHVAGSNPPAGVLPHLVTYFDPDKSGRIGLKESTVRFHQLGLGWVGAGAAATAVNFGLGAKTFSNPFALPVSAMPRAKHASDTDIIRRDGGVNQARLDAVCQKYFGARGELDAAGAARLLKDDLLRDLQPESMFGAVAAMGEIGLLYLLGGQHNERGDFVLKEARFRAFYEDPNVFHQIAGEQAARAHRREQTPVGWVVNQFRKFII